MIYFSSDLHFNHDKEFIWKERGYRSVTEMNDDIIHKWNSVITNDDTVYLLGDVMLKDLDAGLECLMKLKGHIHVIRGNHDTDKRVEFYQTCPNIEDVKYADMIKDGKYNFYLSHYPTMVANFDDVKKLWNLSGHTHTTNKFELFKYQIYNVGVDAHFGFPVSIEKVKQDIRSIRDEINHFNHHSTKY